jgi:hypothetical protein
MILGLDEITFGELRSSEKLVESLRQKLGQLEVSRFPDEELALKANLLIEILRETLLDRYQALSVRAFAHFTVALDYFLTLHERDPDSIKDTLPGGYVDDLKRINDVFRQFDRDIKAFLDWKGRQPAE